MPTYTPVNPELVAFNPGKIAEGMLTPFQLKQILQKIAAQKLAQEEAEATTDGRVAATNAKNKNITVGSLAELPAFDSRIGLELAQNQSKLGLLPAETARSAVGTNLGMLTDSANIPLVQPRADLAKAQIGAGLSKLTPQTTAEIAQAQAATAAANSQVRLNPQTEKLAVADMGKKLGDIGDFDKMRDKNLQLAEIKLNDALKHATSDLELKRAEQIAETDQKKAHAEYFRAQRSYLEAGGRAAAEKDPVQQIGVLQLAIQRLDADYGLQAYTEDNYVDGEFDTGKGLFNLAGTKNQAKEDALAQRAYLVKLQSALIRKAADKIGSEIEAAPLKKGSIAAPATQSPVAPPAPVAPPVKPPERIKMQVKDGKLIPRD